MQLKNLKTNFLGRNAIYYKTIDSTQKEILRRIEEGKIENGTLIFTDIQTSAYGTHGRVWHTEEENNIAFSFLIKPNCKIDKLEGLTRKIAEIIVQIFKEKYNISLEIKEPNDIYLKGKKLGGILTQTKLVLDKVKYLVIGIGINTNKEHFTEDIKDIATSIKKEFGVQIDKEEFIVEFCNVFEKIIIEIMAKK